MYTCELVKFGAAPTEEEVAKIVAAAKSEAIKNQNEAVYRTCFSMLDITQLNVTDNNKHITDFAKKVVDLPQQYPGIKNVASICIYPTFIDKVALAIGDSNIAITSVGAGFPSSQTFVEVKMLEVAMAIENGADEIDIVINVGQMIGGEYEEMASEIKVIKDEIEDTLLKVIIESGALKTPELIWKASLLSMCSGADFIKTSTGKIDISATPEAAVVMCMAAKEYYKRSGRKVGFKVAGGVKSAEDAALYYTIVESILGQEWCNPSLMRIGASSAANTLLAAITKSEVNYF